MMRLELDALGFTNSVFFVCPVLPKRKISSFRVELTVDEFRIFHTKIVCSTDIKESRKLL